MSKRFEMSKIWVTSDTHFGHRNIIKYCNRPFETSEEMNETMIQRWNESISPDDLVFHLGDFSCGISTELNSEIFSRLNGQKVLIVGNHDKKKTLDLEWVEIQDCATIEVGGNTFFMSHRPIDPIDIEKIGDEIDLFLHGHCHGTNTKTHRKLLDVGVDSFSFRPRLLYSELEQ
jgi:calcineurin-like phosphoesterase family protein